tara:strand:- start:8417 stop:9940 length:1524 start_codon:yes stop_codon:yes gene_type:complete
MELRQSTSQLVRFGPFLDSTDGVTPETALTITQADMQLSKDGAAFAQKNAAGNATHDVDGFYFTTFNTTDTNTTANLKFQVAVAGALPVWENYDVVTTTYYDAKYSGTFNNLGGTAQTGDSFARIGVAGVGLTNVPWNSSWDTEVESEVADGLAAFWTSPATLVDLVWDEILTGATHNVNTSAGKRLRQITSTIIRADTAQGSGTGTNQIQLDTGASAVDGTYDPSLISIIAGTGDGQSRAILQYNGATKTATLDRDWKVNPDATSEYTIVGTAGSPHVNEGLLQAGTSSSATLNALASASDNVYVGQLLFIRSGTAADQAKIVIAYNGTTKVATVDGTWAVTPDTTSGYTMLPSSPVMLNSTTQASIDAIEVDTGTTIPSTLSGLATQVSVDTIDTNVDAILVDTGTTLPGLIDDLAVKKNTAFSNFEFLMVLTSDHVSPATGLTVTGQRSIDGSAFATVTGAIAEVSNGIYQFDAVAADTNGDVITWRFSSATADDTFITFKTVA